MTPPSDDVVKVSGPMGFSLEAVGAKAGAALLAVAATGLIVWMIDRHDTKAEVKAEQNHREVMGALSEMVYVLTLPQERREKLNLSMPDSLRGKVRRERGERDQ